jgi:hypothetical protein
MFQQLASRTQFYGLGQQLRQLLASFLRKRHQLGEPKQDALRRLRSSRACISNRRLVPDMTAFDFASCVANPGSFLC